MKITVTYNYILSDEDIRALARYQGERVTKDSIRQNLKDIGTMGLEEQIVEGTRRLEADMKREST